MIDPLSPDASEYVADARVEQAREMAENGAGNMRPMTPRELAVLNFFVLHELHGSPDPTLTLAIRLQSLLRPLGYAISHGDALAVARGLGGEAGR